MVFNFTAISVKTFLQIEPLFDKEINLFTILENQRLLVLISNILQFNIVSHQYMVLSIKEGKKFICITFDYQQ